MASDFFALFGSRNRRDITNLLSDKTVQLKMARPTCSFNSKTANEELILLTNELETKGQVDHRQSSRLHWLNYSKPKVKEKERNMTPAEEDLVIRLHALLGNRWSLIAARLPGKTENYIKNYWNTHLSRKVRAKGMDLQTQNPNDRFEFSAEDMLQPHIHINDNIELFDAPPNSNNMGIPVSFESDTLELQPYNNFDYDFKNITDKIMAMELMNDTHLAWTQYLEGNDTIDLDAPILTSILDDEFQLQHRSLHLIFP